MALACWRTVRHCLGRPTNGYLSGGHFLSAGLCFCTRALPPSPSADRILRFTDAARPGAPVSDVLLLLARHASGHWIETKLQIQDIAQVK